MGLWNTYTMIWTAGGALLLLYNLCDITQALYRHKLGLPSKSHRFSMIFSKENPVKTIEWEDTTFALAVVVFLWPIIVACFIGYLVFRIVRPSAKWIFNTVMKCTLSKEDRATVALGVAKLRKEDI